MSEEKVKKDAPAKAESAPAKGKDAPAKSSSAKATEPVAEGAKAVEAKAGARKRVRKTVSLAHAYVTATYNNTIISIAEPNGNVLAWASAGACGFKGTRKSTPYAATVTAEKVVEKVAPYGVQKLKVFVSGVGTGREQAIRGLHAAGLELEAIFDKTPIPHNGCRKKKARRV